MTDFVEMSGKANKLNEFMKNKHLGSDAQIPTRWSKFFKSIYESNKDNFKKYDFLLKLFDKADIINQINIESD